MLCGEYGLDYSAACRSKFFDVNTCTWSDELITRFGLDRRHYSDPKPMGTIIGHLRDTVRDELGIKGKVKVIIGGHDQTANAIGSGLHQDYSVCSMGTAECITPILKNKLHDDFIADCGIPAEPLWGKGKFCALAYNSTSGLLVQWFLGLFADGGELQYARFDSNVPPNPTKITVQPYLMGSGTPYMDNEARLALAGIDYGTTKDDLYRAILEGLCLDQKLNMAVLRDEQVFVKHLIAVGGGSKSRAWLEIKADILQIPVSTLTVKEAGALGSAVLCAAALGAYNSVEEAAGAMSHIKETIEPNNKNRTFYEEKFEVYRKLHEHVKEESAFSIRGVKL
jgi:xylulokinase